jgi:hypothetical protein
VLCRRSDDGMQRMPRRVKIKIGLSSSQMRSTVSSTTSSNPSTPCNWLTSQICRKERPVRSNSHVTRNRITSIGQATAYQRKLLSVVTSVHTLLLAVSYGIASVPWSESVKQVFPTFSRHSTAFMPAYRLAGCEVKAKWDQFVETIQQNSLQSD